MNTTTLLTIAKSTSFNPYENLGLEKYLFDSVKDNEVILYLWQNEKTVVCGRNQNVFKECNLTALSDANGCVARRLSGGGAVFHDLGNLNFTFIAKDVNYDLKRQQTVITEACKAFGVPACITGRNDITADGKKFSGNAFYKSNGTQYQHGTLMIDVDFDRLSDYLNVDRSKLQSHGVDSVRSRVVNLNSFSESINIDSMKEALICAFLRVYSNENSQINHFSADLYALEKVSENKLFFENPDWIFGKKQSFSNKITSRFSWGDVEFLFNIKGDRITSLGVFSDSLIPEFVLMLEKKLVGVRYSSDTLCKTVDLVNDCLPDDYSVQCTDIKNLFCASI